MKFIRDRDRPEIPGQELIRVKLPRGKQMLGEIEQILGGSRFKVSCKDGNERLCRIPGKFRKRITVRVGDIVIVEPWEVEGNEKGDVVWIYNRTQMAWLRKRGYA